MKKVKTHKFRLGKYYIDEDACEGFCDLPGDASKLRMHILKGRGFRSLVSAIHESMHAEGISKHFLDEDRDSAEAISKFLWRLGWRRNKKT